MKKKILLALLLAVMVPQLAMAQVSFRRENAEDKLNFEMNPGEELTHTLYAVNLSDEVKTVTLFATDGVITPTGTFTSSSKYDKQNHTGKWISFSEPRLTLEPDTEKEVSFTIKVDPGATPGSYAGGLSIEPVNPAVEMKQTGAVTSTRVVVPIWVVVQGEKVTGFSLDSLEYAHTPRHTFSFNLRNDGNTILKALGEIEIRNITGETYTLTVPEITLLQNSAQKTDINWDEKPFWGVFTATAKMKITEYDIASNSYTLVENVEKSVTFTVIPWPVVIGVPALLFLILLIVVIKVVSAGAYRRKCVSYTVAEGETLMSISKRLGANWQKVAKVNKLKAPYEVTKGQKILVPPAKK